MSPILRTFFSSIFSSKIETSASYKTESFLVQVIKQLAQKYTIKLDAFSDNRILRLEKDTLSYFIFNYTFNLNPAASSQVCQNKHITSQVFASENISHICQHAFFSPSDFCSISQKEQKTTLFKLFTLYHNQVVLKPSNGTGGKDVYLIKTQKDLKKKFNKLLKKYDSLTLSPFYFFSYEYRVIILNDEVQLIYKKIRPHVIGDGINTVRTLLLKHPEEPIVKHTTLSILSEPWLVKKHLLNSIPSKGEKLEIQWKHNLSTGAKAELSIPNKLKPQLEKQSLKAMQALGMKFASVDIADINGELKIIEVNNGVMMEKLEKQASSLLRKKIFYIYEKAFCLMLDLKMKV